MTTTSKALTQVRTVNGEIIKHRHAIKGRVGMTRWHHIRERHLRDPEAHYKCDAARPEFAANVDAAAKQRYAKQLKEAATHQHTGQHGRDCKLCVSFNEAAAREQQQAAATAQRVNGDRRNSDPKQNLKVAARERQVRKPGPLLLKDQATVKTKEL